MSRSDSTPRLAVLFGSQTGTAQDTAERVGRIAIRQLLDVRVAAMDDFRVQRLLEFDAVVFVCSTTGQGEEPDNMKRFWRFLLRRALPSDALANVSFAVLGLGDSSYPKFNFVAKRLFKRLQQLGAEPFQELGLADDQHDLGVDGVAAPWIQRFKAYLSTAFPQPDGVDPMPDGSLLPSRFNVEWLPDVVEANVVATSNESNERSSAEFPFSARITANDRVTSSEHWQDVRRIGFCIRDSGISYRPGDVVVIRPRNSEKSVSRFLQLLNLDPSRKFRLRANNPDGITPSRLPNPCSVRYLVENYLDINGIPRLYFWELLAAFTDDENEKEKLEEFLTPEGTQDLWDYCNRMRRNCVEVLHDFPHAASKVPFEYLFDLIPPLQPRSFSIASSPRKHGDVLEILVAVVKYRTKLMEPRLGVCSNWLAASPPGNDCHALLWTCRGTLDFPAPSTPLIMIGPGTGVAPFRSLIHERTLTAETNECNLFLFFGCRHETKDFYCAEEWRPLQSQGLLRIFTAFSRDGDEKVYVQDKLLEESSLVWQLIHNKGAYVFLAGNAKRIPEDIWATFRKIVVKEEGLSELEAEAYLKDMERTGRYQQETWS